MKDGKIAVIEEEAELVRMIFRRYLELGSVNELVRDLKERNIRTRIKRLATGKTRGGIPFGRGALYYLLSNHFYIGDAFLAPNLVKAAVEGRLPRGIGPELRRPKSRDYGCSAVPLRAPSP